MDRKNQSHKDCFEIKDCAEEQTINSESSMIKSEAIQNLLARFESIACEYEGVECWSARELYPILAMPNGKRLRMF